MIVAAAVSLDMQSSSQPCGCETSRTLYGVMEPTTEEGEAFVLNAEEPCGLANNPSEAAVAVAIAT